MNFQEMTGLQLIEAMLRGELPMPPMAKTIPMTVQSAEWGRVVFVATANETHANPMGGVHGGFAATVLDSVTGCATHTTLAAGEAYGTIELNVKMVRPVPYHKPLQAEGRVINAGKRLVISEAYLRDEEGTLYAHGTASCMILR